MNKAFKSYLDFSAEEINLQLKNLLNDWSRRNDIHPRIKKLTKLYVSSVMGGKCIRGTLVKLGYELSGAPKNFEILKVAAAYEILHASLLVHDDVIDKSVVRRGKPTIHKTLGNDHYAMSQGICLGDLGFFIATKFLAESKFTKMPQAISLFSEIVTYTVLGQMLDIELSLPKLIKKEKDVLLIHKLKTAEYTIVGPLLLGATIGNASEKTLEAVKKFGENSGIAFQIQDDILGVFGDEKIIGKSTKSDIEEGKNTLLFTYAFDIANVKQKKLLENFYGKGKLSDKDYGIVKEIFIQTGALNYSQKKAEKYIALGKKSIPDLSNDKSIQTMFADFADFIIQRKK